MLTALNLVQLVLYIALMAMAGQGLLYVLAGARRESNVFYTLLRVIGRPFTALVRALTPAKVSDQHVGILTFALLLLVYVVVTIERVRLCVQVGVEVCK
jgi:hypothetical protein